MRTAAAFAAAVLALAGCGGSAASHPGGPASTTAAPAASPAQALPAGCLQAATVAAAIRTKLEQSPSDVTGQAYAQLHELQKSLPLNQLRIDVDRAVLDIALFRQYVAIGGPASKAAKNFAADLNRITRLCSA